MNNCQSCGKFIPVKTFLCSKCVNEGIQQFFGDETTIGTIRQMMKENFNLKEENRSLVVKAAQLQMKLTDLKRSLKK